MEFTDEEKDKLVEAFKSLHVKPKFDSPSDLEDWMKHYKAEAKPDASPHAPTSNPVTVVHSPRLSTFSGCHTKKDSEAPYDLWKYEVNCLCTEGRFSLDAIREAVRRSLRGEAARIAMRLGPQATLTQLLAKFDSVYGTVQVTENILAQFYSARQKDDEDVSEWSCRLEDILAKAVEKGQVKIDQMEEMLRCMFWTGLQQRLKDISGHKFDTVLHFDELRIAIRQVETDLKQRRQELGSTKATHSNMAAASQPSNTDTELKELKAMVQQLSAEVRSIKQPNRQMELPNAAPRQQHGPRRYQSEYEPSRRGKQPQQGEDDSDGPTCWRCGQKGQKGHIKRGCRAKLDTHHLNNQRSTGAGNL